MVDTTIQQNAQNTHNSQADTLQNFIYHPNENNPNVASITVRPGIELILEDFNLNKKYKLIQNKYENDGFNILYEDIELITQTVNSVVFKGKNPQNEFVAIKIEAADEEGVSRLQYEHKLLMTLSHPNVQKTIDFIVVPNVNIIESYPDAQIQTVSGKKNEYYAIMISQYYSGGNLLQFLNEGGFWQKGNFDLEGFYYFYNRISNGLVYLHMCNIVHRDLKPENIILEPEVISSNKIVKNPVLADYGLSNHVIDGTDGIGGSITHMAPEVIRFGLSDDCRTDIFSYGIIIYQLLTGQYPFNLTNNGMLDMINRMNDGWNKNMLPIDLIKGIGFSDELISKLNGFFSFCMSNKQSSRFSSVIRMTNELNRIIEKTIEELKVKEA